MKTQIDYNTRRALQAIARRNREDAKLMAELHMKEMLETREGLFHPGIDSKLMGFTAVIQQAKTQAEMIEKWLERLENQETPAIERATR